MPLARALKMILTLRCHESSRLLSDGMDRHLTLSERIAVRLHLLGCRSCRRFGRDLRLLREVLRHLRQRPTATRGDHAPLSPEARERLRTTVRKAQEDSQ